MRPAPGEPHRLGVLPPATRWSAPAKAATGAAALFALLFLVPWASWVGTIAVAPGMPGALPMLAGFGVWTVVACTVVGLFFLDALRAGGRHAKLWGTLLALGWVLAPPLYWLLYVRPTAPPDGGP